MTAKAAASLTRLRNAYDGTARAQAREELRRLGEKAASALVTALADPDGMVRWEAVNLLGELAPKAHCRAVVEFALREREPHACWRAKWAVSRFDPATTTPLLLRALRGNAIMRRWSAALILAMMARPEAGEVVLEGLNSPCGWTRWEALGAVRNLRLRKALPRLGRFLRPAVPVPERQEAVLALGAIGTAGAAALLERALADPSPEVRWRASMGLEQVKRTGDHYGTQKETTGR